MENTVNYPIRMDHADERALDDDAAPPVFGESRGEAPSTSDRQVISAETYYNEVIEDLARAQRAYRGNNIDTMHEWLAEAVAIAETAITMFPDQRLQFESFFILPRCGEVIAKYYGILQSLFRMRQERDTADVPRIKGELADLKTKVPFVSRRVSDVFGVMKSLHQEIRSLGITLDEVSVRGWNPQ